MATLQKAFEQLKSDPGLAKKFQKDPKGVLKELGVDPAKVHISRTAGGRGLIPPPSQTLATTCVSVGCIVCASIG
jgi:hypothetical protein